MTCSNANSQLNLYNHRVNKSILTLWKDYQNMASTVVFNIVFRVHCNLFIVYLFYWKSADLRQNVRTRKIGRLRSFADRARNLSSPGLWYGVCKTMLLFKSYKGSQKLRKTVQLFPWNLLHAYFMEKRWNKGYLLITRKDLFNNAQ